MNEPRGDSTFTGRRLGLYQIAELLGAGGMGSVSRPRHQARARCGHQSSSGSVRRRRRSVGSFSARSEDAGRAEPPEHCDDSRAGAIRGCSLSGDGTGPRRDAGPASQNRCTEYQGGARDRRSGRGSAGSGARNGGDSSGPEAGQRERDAGRPGQGPGFWFGEGLCRRRRRGPVPGTDAHRDGRQRRRDCGHAGLHESRAGARRSSSSRSRDLARKSRSPRMAGPTLFGGARAASSTTATGTR